MGLISLKRVANHPFSHKTTIDTHFRAMEPLPVYPRAATSVEVAAHPGTTRSLNHLDAVVTDIKIPHQAHIRKNTPPTSRPTKTPPLSPTSKRKPAPLVAPAPHSSPSSPRSAPCPVTAIVVASPSGNTTAPQTRQRQHSGERLDQTRRTRQYSSGSSFSSLNGPPVIPRVPSLLPTGTPSPPLILTSFGVDCSPPSSYSSSPLEPSMLPYSSHSHPFPTSFGREKNLVNSSPTRRAPSIDSPIRDPYRFRTSSISARGVKNDYQSQIQLQPQVQGQLQTQSLAQAHPTMRAYRTSEGYQSVPDEQGSPTLAASQPLWARTQTSTESSAAAGESLGAGVDPSSFKGYQPVQQPSHPPYPSSPILQTQDRQDYRSDPYRSAYSQHHHHQFQQRGSHSPYHDSPASFEEMNQMTHSSKYSLSSTNSGGGGGHNGNGGHQQYEMRRLHSLEPDQTTSIPDQYPLPNAHSSQQRLKQEEEGKNADVIPKTSSETGTPSGVGQSSLSSKGKKKQCYNSEDSDEEEGQERGALRQKDSKRCWCCSRRTCVYISFVVLICLAVALYFVVPRSPSFSFESVTPLGDPVVTKNQIQESFSLQMRVDSQVNYVPLRFTSLEMGVWMKIDQTKIGNNEGLPSSFLIRPRIAQVISVPMTLDYRSLKIDTNADGTLQELFTACKPVDLSSGALVPGINLTIGGKMFIRGLSWIWKPQFSFNVDRVPCPVNARKHVTEPTSPSSGSGAGAETPSGSNGGASETMSQTTNPSITPSSRSSQASTPGNTAGSTTTLSS